MLGVANVLQPDPELGGQATPIARLFNVAAPAAIMVSGLYALPLAALGGSYRLIPPGEMLPAADTAETAANAAAAAFALAVRLASPFLLVSVVWHVAIGLLARLVPRMQVYFVVMPGQILGGVWLLTMLATALIGAWLAALQTGFGLLPGH
jgi:flagellar biosynthetic protein FliR